MMHEKRDPSPKDIAKEAVKEVFAILGVDVDEPKDVEDFRRDLRFAGDLRRKTNQGGWLILATVIGLVITAIWANIIK